ncbi:hypothetical protein [Nocardia vinacea]|uniref:hypothetical protein n=1 Tax=Nocardia vinacea TaxID=96468 RepID=UPI0012F67F9E|nr:hypothetical protein [Nocardia vinacea]
MRFSVSTVGDQPVACQEAFDCDRDRFGQYGFHGSGQRSPARDDDFAAPTPTYTQLHGLVALIITDAAPESR